MVGTGEAGGEGTPEEVIKRTAVTAVVALLVVASALSGMILLLPEPGGGGDDGGEGDDGDGGSQEIAEIPSTARFVFEDETWRGLSGWLCQTVEIKNARLSIVDSDITLRLEDALVDDRSNEDAFFSVPKWSSLSIINSTIHLECDQRLAHAAWLDNTGDSTSSRWSRYAYLTRAVNLRYAEEPVLELDIQWRSKGDPLCVAVQPSPRSGLTFLEELAPPAGGLGEWEHHQVDLTAYAGGIPRLVLFSWRDEGVKLIISGLRVTDGGETPEGDAFPTGGPFEDRWEVWGLDEFDLQRWTVPLIASCSTVRIEDSTISADPWIPRAARGDNVLGKVPDLNAMFEGWNVNTCSRNGHIEVTDGELVANRSTISNVPVVTRRGSVDLKLCELVGDCDLLTMHGTDGAVRDCTLTNRTPEGPDPPWREDDRYRLYRWAMSVQNVSLPEPLEVSRCAFVGAEVGADLTHSNVEMSDCTFEGCLDVALWEHECWSSGGSVNWSVDSVMDGLAFEDCEGALYFRTADLSVWPVRPLGVPSSIDADPRCSIPWGEVVHLPMGDSVRFTYQSDLLAYCHRPAEVVWANGSREVFDRVPLEVRTDWGHTTLVLESYPTYMEVLVPASEGIVPEDTDPYNLSQTMEVYLDGSEYDGAMGRLSFSFLSDLSEALVNEVVARAFLNGRLAEEYVLLGKGDWKPVYLESGWLNLSVPPGSSNVTLTVTGNSSLTGASFEVLNTSFQLHRLTGGREELVFDDSSLVEAFVWVVVDEGAAAELVCSQVPGGMVDPWLKVTLGNGSTLVMEDLTASLESGFYLEVDGGGRLEVVGPEVWNLWLIVEGSDVLVSGTPGEFCLEYISLEQASLAIEGCTILPNETYIQVDDSDLSLVGCDVRRDPSLDGTEGYWLSFIVLYSEGNSNTTLRDCVLDDVPLYIYEDYPLGDLGVVVEGCTFLGDHGRMVAEFDPHRRDPHSGLSFDASIAGNTFVGGGTKLELSIEHVPLALGENEFLEGARARTTLDIDVTARDEEGELEHVMFIAKGLPPGVYATDEGVPLQYALWIDITEGPGALDGLGRAHVCVIYGSIYWDDPILWFDTVDLSEGDVELEVPTWPPVADLIVEHVTGVDVTGDGSDWWTHG